MINFTMLELVGLMGLAQCLYVLVYMGLRSNRLNRATLAFLFFGVLAVAFLLTVAESRWATAFDRYHDIKWVFWTLLHPLSTLLIIQISTVITLPSRMFASILVLIPIGYILSRISANAYGDLTLWLSLSSIFVGGLSLIAVWAKREGLDGLHMRKNGRERYWLIMSIIILNVALLVTHFLYFNDEYLIDNIELVRNMIGVSFVYLALTSLFRVYPQAVSITPNQTEVQNKFLNDTEIAIAMRIEDLLHVEKVYHEPSYKRSDMARELEISDAHLSKIVNVYFEKSVPQLLNTYKVEDSKHLLKETPEDIAVISQEAGFNSIATFNRVFKEIEGVTPTEYRESTK